MQKHLIPLITLLTLFLWINVSLASAPINILISTGLILVLSVVIIIKDKRKSMKIMYSLMVLIALYIMVNSILKLV